MKINGAQPSPNKPDFEKSRFLLIKMLMKQY